MMKKLLEKVTALVGEELEEANKNNPPLFHSAHEGYGVIAEEMMEVRNEYSWFASDFESLLRSIQMDDWGRVRVDSCELRRTAVNVACECIQVAAMCNKLINTVEANVE